MAIYATSNQKVWDTYLNLVVYVNNISMSETTGETPLFLTYWHEPIKLPNISFITALSIKVCQSP